MGYIRHTALIVNGDAAADVALAHTKIARLYAAASTEDDNFAALVTPLMSHAVNGGASFMIAPDGSKEGWGTSNESDSLMAEAKRLIGDINYVDFIEVLIGGDDGEYAVIDHT